MKLEYVTFLIAYLLGSVPTGYVLVKMIRGIDIRSQGSGNIGATNVYRQSRWAGMVTLVLDVAKGYVAVWLATVVSTDVIFPALAAVAVILGHIFSLFLGFKGGKGVATGCGAYLAVSPQAVATVLLVFILVVGLTRYISLASILATVAFPVCVYLYGEPMQVVFAAAVGSALIVAKHHQNVRRLLTGRENKFALGSHS